MTTNPPHDSDTTPTLGSSTGLSSSLSQRTTSAPARVTCSIACSVASRVASRSTSIGKRGHDDTGPSTPPQRISKSIHHHHKRRRIAIAIEATAETPRPSSSLSHSSSSNPRTDDSIIPPRRPSLLSHPPTTSVSHFALTAPPAVRGLSAGHHCKKITEDPEPLFFSDTHQRARPELPPRFSSGEAGARMLSKAQADESNFKTVTLARANIAAEISPPGPGFLNFTSRTASEKSSSLQPAESPDERSERAEQVRLLSQIGIAELFEQDTRPTFIVDVYDSQYQALRALQLVFANNALRILPDLLELVQSSKHANQQSLVDFQSWVMTPKSERDSPDITPTIAFSNILWKRSTLRRRIRIISALSDLDSPPLPKSPSRSTPSSKSSRLTPEIIPIRDNKSQVATSAESSDYFGAISRTEPGHLNANGMPLRTNERRIPSAVPTHVGAIQPPNATTPTHLRNISEDINAPEVGFFDWTRLPLNSDLPRHIRFARTVDWTSTALGSIEFWPPDLRQMCNLIMASPHPSAMYWGTDLVAIYNEAYVMLAGQKHPALMGQRYRDAWPELWSDVKDVFADAIQTGQATMKDDDRLFMKRSNYLEETYFSWSIIPMVGGDGSVCGLYNPAFEKTRRKIAERRMLTLREVGERTASARDIKGFWKAVELGFESNEWDNPFVLLYSVSEEADSDSSSIYSASLMGSKQCYLEGSLGVPEGHPCAPKQFDLKSETEGFAPLLREAVTIGGPALLRVTGLPSEGHSNGSRSVEDPEDLADSATLEIPCTMLQGIEWRGFQDPCRSVVICPVYSTPGEAILGFMVIGVNPRRPYDEDYSLYIQLLTRQCATSLASVVLFEEEIKRGQKAARQAALDKIQLSEELAARTQEAREIEVRFTHMAKFSPAGLFIADSEGRIAYCNNRWYEISGVPKDQADNWLDFVKESDQEEVRMRWGQLVKDAQPVNFEFRFKGQWEDSSGNMSDTWVLFSAHPEKTEDAYGSHLKSVFGNLTDISTQKWVQGFQTKKTEEAVKLKRQQEEFIDITSHEMRNPLSAVLQCADQISSTLSDFAFSNDEADHDIIMSSIDAAETIVECAQHQKRIVDDILALSKLDSKMLAVAPVDVQPQVILQRALRMFESESEKAGIELRLKIDESYTQLGVDWAKLDPQRVGQVLINLVTNAIKFTSNDQDRKSYIEVGLAASRIRPSAQAMPLVQYFPARSPPDSELMKGDDWGTGEPFYIEYSVKDTGPGLTNDEKMMLFNKFTQASHRTHVHYGGSGLGLFISRELTELQGGEIGVHSESGKGSTFAFYISSRKSTRPENPEIGIPANLRVLDSKNRRADKVLSPAARFKKAKGTSLLVVEDNLVNQRVLQKQLKTLGFTVHVANHGGEALDILQGSNFWKRRGHEAASSAVVQITVVLMDQEMPVMDGIQCTKQIREWEKDDLLTSRVPIIGVTANARQEQISELLEAGMDDVVSKPFRLVELLPKVEELANKLGRPPS